MKKAGWNRSKEKVELSLFLHKGTTKLVVSGNGSKPLGPMQQFIAQQILIGQKKYGNIFQ